MSDLYTNPLLYSLVILFISLAIGSFLNVVIYRLPLILSHNLDKTLNLAWPPSFCPYCQHSINWYDNIPLLSFLILKGRCRYCHQKINFIYSLADLLISPINFIPF